MRENGAAKAKRSARGKATIDFMPVVKTLPPMGRRDLAPDLKSNPKTRISPSAFAISAWAFQSSAASAFLKSPPSLAPTGFASSAIGISKQRGRSKPMPGGLARIQALG